ncbi:MAG: GNAT family N-acetyltransferase [Acidimicrobiia bacterium]|nr:GNAT family N-acetyltransferase [Acidimicrobiia bacterium]
MPVPLIRPVTEADLDTVLDLVNRTRASDGIAEVLSIEELVDDLTGDQGDMASDSLLVEVDDEVVGYAHTMYLPSEVRLERCYVIGLVHPEHRGVGLGRQLLGWAIDRAAEQLRSSGSDLPKYIRVDEYDFVESAHRLFARMGFEPVRYFDQLLRPLTDLPPLERTEIEGITITPWTEERSEEVRVVKNEAFADHWGSTPTSRARWETRMNASTTRPDLSWIALNDDGAVIGYCINDRYEADDATTGRKEAWIGGVGTLRDYRRRGTASALMIRSLHAFADDGLDHAILGVDSDNPTGAPSLYRGLGFEPHTRTITHEIRIE